MRKDQKRRSLIPIFFLVIIIIGLLFAEGLGHKPFFSSFNKLTDKESSGETAPESYFTLLHTNDEHSALLPHTATGVLQEETEVTSIGGIARVASAAAQIREEKKKGEAVLLLSAGDFLGGPFAWLALHEMAPELSLMQQTGYDVITLGNHEFDYGPEVLAQYLEAAGYPESHEETAIVASNTLVPTDHPLQGVNLKKRHVKRIDDDLKLGFFGLMGKHAAMVSRNAPPVSFSNQHTAARREIAQLKEQGADVIVALTHSGVAEDRKLAQEVDGIDIIIGGHSHTRLKEPVIEGGTIIAQAGSLWSHLGILELAYEEETGKIRLRNSETGRPYLLPILSSFEYFPQVETSLDHYLFQLDDFMEQISGGYFSQVMETIAYSDFPLRNYPLLEETTAGNFVTDAMRLTVEEQTGKRVDFAFQTNGQIRGTLYPGITEEKLGPIKLYDLLKISGMGSGVDHRPGYPLTSVYLTSAEVNRLLEMSTYLSRLMGNSNFLQVSGLQYDYNARGSVLFNIPLVNIPVPAFQAVQNIERYTGKGVQDPHDENFFVPLKEEDRDLYHVVMGYHLLSTIQNLNEFIPSFLGVDPKNSQGNPLDNAEEAIVKKDGKEIKIWQALGDYTQQEKIFEGEEVSVIPVYYSETSGRINKRQDSLPLSRLMLSIIKLWPF